MRAPVHWHTASFYLPFSSTSITLVSGRDLSVFLILCVLQRWLGASVTDIVDLDGRCCGQRGEGSE